MQWIFMLIGLVLGWTLDESFYDAGIGALLGLGIGQAIRLTKLAAQAEQQAAAHRALVQKLVLQPAAQAAGEVGFLNYDPICDCQDSGAFTLDSATHQARPWHGLGIRRLVIPGTCRCRRPIG